jgi:hypothetical protein|tara:strand:+ start:538 stop:1140 length:603 start_codon:yes stop_codon:yes gene_type:complete
MANYRQYTTLVTAGEVISKTFTNKNTDPTLVSENTIVLAELAHLRPLLGEDFYGELKLQNDGGTLTADNQTLMTYYLQDCLAWYVRFEVVNDIMSNITSSGVVHNVDEFNRLITADDYNAFKQDTYRKAEIFAKDMMDFITGTDQDGLYPTYEDNRPNSMSDTYKNHGLIFYDSIYTYPNGTCSTCTSSPCVCSGNCNDC